MNTGLGVIQGGWEFVWAAYGVSAAILIGYALSVFLRRRALLRRRLTEGSPVVNR